MSTAVAEPVAIGTPEYSEVVDFLYREARLLDGYDHRRWLEVLHPDIDYRMPVRLTRMPKDGLGFVDEMEYFAENFSSVRAPFTDPAPGSVPRWGSVADPEAGCPRSSTGGATAPAGAAAADAGAGAAAGTRTEDAADPGAGDADADADDPGTRDAAEPGPGPTPTPIPRLRTGSELGRG